MMLKRISEQLGTALGEEITGNTGGGFPYPVTVWKSSRRIKWLKTRDRIRAHRKQIKPLEARVPARVEAWETGWRNGG